MQSTGSDLLLRRTGWLTQTFAPGAKLLVLAGALGLVFTLANCGGDTPTAPAPTTLPPSPSQPPAPSPPPPAPISHSGQFTDSQGRTIAYGLRMRQDWDLTEPRGTFIYFHGNNTGTREAYAGPVFLRPSEVTALLDMGLAVAGVGSPDAYRYPPEPPPTFLTAWIGAEHGTRVWRRADYRVVHELLQSGFDGNLVVDQDRVVLMGGSSGTCFLAGFFERYVGTYGGGFHAHCGCFWGGEWWPRGLPPRSSDVWTPTFPWTPSAASMVRERWRVFVEATTGDFLHIDAVRMAEYYGDVLGLEMRSDLAAPGGHCAPGSTPHVEIWEWLAQAGEGTEPEQAPVGDADGDGIANNMDDDDDNDGAWDAVDAFPLDAREWRDTDGDGVGNFEDRDADGDGVPNAEDAFALDPGEWLDTDADGIGNNLDRDDDNDGLPDARDNLPLEGDGGDQLTLSAFWDVESYAVPGYLAASVHSSRPAGVSPVLSTTPPREWLGLPVSAHGRSDRRARTLRDNPPLRTL